VANTSRAFVDLAQTHLLRAQEVLVLESSEVERYQYSLPEFRCDVGDLLLRPLEGECSGR
jgi:hypothetical protein